MTLLKKINKFLTEKEPAWRWELFCVLFCVITIWYLWIAPVLYVDTHFYYPLPLFKLFRIPHPGLVTDFMAGVFPGFDLFFILKIFCVVNLFLLALGFFRKFFVLCSLVSFFFFQGWLYGYIRMPDSTYVYHHTNIIFFILLIHLIAPAYPPRPQKPGRGFSVAVFFDQKLSLVSPLFLRICGGHGSLLF